MTLHWSADKGQVLQAAGYALEYACYGPPPGTAPTLVLLHEGLGCVSLWKDFPELLAEATGLGVFAFSRAGYGASEPVPLPRPLDYMSREATTVLGPVLDAAGLGDVILLGHSDGATIAAEYAGSVSDMRVRGLVLIAPHFFTEAAGLSAIRAAGKRFSSGDLRDKLARYHNDPDIAFKGWHDAWTDPGFAGWNVADCIDHWRIPVLALQGDEDPYGSVAQIDEIDARIYSPLDVVIVPACGHAPHSEHPDTTISAIADFTDRLIRLEKVDVATA